MEYYQNCCVLECVTQSSQSAAHLYEQFLRVVGFVILGPLCCGYRQLCRAACQSHIVESDSGILVRQRIPGTLVTKTLGGCGRKGTHK